MKRLMTNLKRLWLCLTLSALALASPGAARANPEVCQKILPKTVWIVGDNSMGSGILIDRPLRLVATVDHVVKDQDEVTVFFPALDSSGEPITDPAYYIKRRDELGIPGRVVARKGKADLALVQLERLPEGVKAVKLAPAAPRRGEPLSALGNSGVAQGALWRYSLGQVRNVYLRDWWVSGHHYTAKVVETTLPTNRGDSGGPLVNDQGELVALTHGAEIKDKDGVPVNSVMTAIYAGPLGAMVEKVREKARAAREPQRVGAGNAARLAQAFGADTLVGTWRRTTPDSRGYVPRWTFRGDGVLEMALIGPDGKVKPAGTVRYRVAGGVLTLFGEGVASARFNLTWQGTRRFSLAIDAFGASTWVQAGEQEGQPAPLHS